MTADNGRSTGSALPGLDPASLSEFLRTRDIPVLLGEELRAARAPGGRSNLTYLVTDGRQQVVVRRPPLGNVLPTAHDMAREFRVLRALDATDVPVPTPFVYCDDEAVLGAPFYVMEMVEGTIHRSADGLGELSTADRAALSEALVSNLALLHRVEPDSVGLGDFGRPEGFVLRQVRRWSEQWHRSKTRELPEVDELARRLERSVPQQSQVSIIHGDFRLENLVLAPDAPGVVRGVLDWEMAALGDPLTDVGFTLAYWLSEGGPILSEDGPVRGPGFPTQDRLAQRYEELSGVDVSQLDFYRVLALFKVAIIFEGIHARYLADDTDGQGFETFGERVPELCTEALEIASNSTQRVLRG